MSYDVQIFRQEVKQAHEENTAPDFFEKPANLLAFTADQKEALKNRLLQYDYLVTGEENHMINFSHPKHESINALLTNNALYFAASGDGIFEISMTASEFTDDGQFAKFDPQDGGWED